jgi:hypothetical protein
MYDKIGYVFENGKVIWVCCSLSWDAMLVARSAFRKTHPHWDSQFEMRAEPSCTKEAPEPWDACTVQTF